MIYTNQIVILDKVINRFLNRKNCLWRKVSSKKVAAWLRGNEDIGRDHLRRLLFNVCGELTSVDICRISESDRINIIDCADHALAHEFDLLGSGWTKVDPIDWHCDFKSGHRWLPGKFYSDYKLVSTDGGYDIKTVWDLGRSQHLLWLAQAFLLTGCEEYANEIVKEICQWIDENPLHFSVGWTCAMDVAIRAVNWMYAVGMIIDSDAVSDDFCSLLYNSLFEHLFFISNHLEKKIPNSGNHYLSDLVGMIYIAPLFPKSFYARMAFRFAYKEFLREAKREITSDGTNYEHSISYHRLVSELFLWGYSVLVRLNQIIDHETSEKIKKLVDYIAAYTKRSGLSPLIGDNDNGRLLPFVARDFRKHGYMTSLASALWGHIYDGFEQITPESIFIGLELKNQLTKKISVKNLPRLYPDNRLAIVKESDCELIVTNSGLSFGGGNDPTRIYGTHTHSDALSFDLSINGDDIIVDPGTGVYTSDPILRNEMRATSNHSTIIVDGLNQSELFANMFQMRHFLSNQTLEVSENGILGGYKFNNGNIEFTHNREFILGANCLEIIDEIVCNGAHEVKVNFHLSPEVGLHIFNGIAHIETERVNINLVGEVGAEIVDSHFSPSYGVIMDSQNIQFTYNLHDRIRIKSVLEWTKK